MDPSDQVETSLDASSVIDDDHNNDVWEASNAQSNHVVSPTCYRFSPPTYRLTQLPT